MTWSLEQAQRNFDQLFDLAIDEGPQMIEHENKTFVLLDEHEWDRLVEEHRKRHGTPAAEKNSAANEP